MYLATQRATRFMAFERDMTQCRSCAQMPRCRYKVGECAKADFAIYDWEGTHRPRPETVMEYEKFAWVGLQRILLGVLALALAVVLVTGIFIHAAHTGDVITNHEPTAAEIHATTMEGR